MDALQKMPYLMHVIKETQRYACISEAAYLLFKLWNHFYVGSILVNSAVCKHLFTCNVIKTFKHYVWRNNGCCVTVQDVSSNSFKLKDSSK